MGKTPAERDVTPEAIYKRRREFLTQSGLFLGTGAAWGTGLMALSGRGVADVPPEPEAVVVPPEQKSTWEQIKKSKYRVESEPTPFRDVTTYNNFYELGVSKADPAQNAGTLKPRPWTVTIDGEVEEAQTLDIDTLLSWFSLEERIYRFRCVERWSMVIPWVGFPLSDLIRRAKPTSAAKFVALTTLLDPKQLPGQKEDVLPWPYVEGLRMDEAMNPLTLLATGIYGKPLLGQNGAPLRLVVPWKYGFKSVKSIVKITFTKGQPRTTWNAAAPDEYGFYANVNPKVDHPRWSQAQERPIGSLSNRDTLMFNGYGEEVASLYQGMDLEENF